MRSKFSLASNSISAMIASFCSIFRLRLLISARKWALLLLASFCYIRREVITASSSLSLPISLLFSSRDR
jgi:hypothetical protein